MCISPPATMMTPEICLTQQSPASCPERRLQQERISTAHTTRKYRVSFSQTCNVQFVEPRSSLTSSERDAYWYKEADVKTFHKEARETCRKARTENAIAPVVCRGLELRVSSARQKRKLMTLQCVRMCQKRLLNPLQMAHIIARCSHWAVQVAQAEAQRDFIRAYADDKCQAFLPPLPAMTPFPLPLKGSSSTQKRPATATRTETDDAEAQRCVRRRISVC